MAAMTSQRRIEALTRHLTSASLEEDATLRSFQPREMYEFLTRDNLKLRLQIMDFLKVTKPARDWPGLLFTICTATLAALLWQLAQLGCCRMTCISPTTTSA